MLLAIDAGNTNIVFAIYDGNAVRAQWRAVTHVSRTADEYAVWLSQLLALEGLSFADLDAAIIATVVPAVLFDLRDLCRKYLKTEPLRVGDPALDIGPKPTVDRPESVGADRICNTVAAHGTYKGAVIVVDFGTATNFDIVAENGAFDGSVIAMGRWAGSTPSWRSASSKEERVPDPCSRTIHCAWRIHVSSTTSTASRPTSTIRSVAIGQCASAGSSITPSTKPSSAAPLRTRAAAPSLLSIASSTVMAG